MSTPTVRNLPAAIIPVAHELPVDETALLAAGVATPEEVLVEKVSELKVSVPSSPITLKERCRRYSVEMHAYTTLQSDIAKQLVAKRGPLMSSNSDSSFTSESSFGSASNSPFPIIKA